MNITSTSRCLAACLLAFTFVAPTMAQKQEQKKKPLQPQKQVPDSIKPLPAEKQELPTTADGKITSRRSSADPADSPLVWSAMTHDWGSITDLEPVDFVFHFQNTTDQSIEIDKARASCGCTVPTIEPKIIPPGGSGELNVRFNPQNRRGPQHKTVTVFYVDPALPNTQLEVSSFVKPQVTLEPNKTFIRRVDRGREETTQVQVIGRDPSFRITQVNTNSEYVTATFSAPSDITVDGEELKQVKIDFVVSGDAPIGRVDALVEILTNDPKMPEIRHNLSAQVMGDLVSVPSSLSLKQQSPYEPFASSIRLESRTNQAFEITDITITGDDGHAMVIDFRSTSLNNKPGVLITINGVTTERYGPIRGDLVIATTLGEGEVISVPFTGFVNRNNPKVAKNNLDEK